MKKRGTQAGPSFFGRKISVITSVLEPVLLAVPELADQ